VLVIAALFFALIPTPSRAMGSFFSRAQFQVMESGVTGGLIIQIGCHGGHQLTGFRVVGKFQVHGLDTESANIEKARAFILKQGRYGDISADTFDGRNLPYIDNLVNIVYADKLGDVSMKEVMRVLAPGGVAIIHKNGKCTRTVKPRPKNIDEWTHFMHDAGGNAVAHDDVVGPPRHLQWLGSPRWSRHHDRMASMSAMVSAGGRVFYIMDEGSRISIQMPPKWMLVARDAFNGTILWKQPIKKWHSHLWPLKSGPTQLARRLVATKDRVYVTLGIDAPLTALDAASGKIVHTYKDTGGTEEIIFSNGNLYLLVNKGDSPLRKFAPQHNVGDQARVRKEFLWNQQPRLVMSFDAEPGSLNWKQKSKVAPLTLSANAERAFFHDGEKVVCLDGTSGEAVWASERTARRPDVAFNFGPKLVIYKEVVLYAGGDKKILALAIKDGSQLWSAPHVQSAYASPEDLLVAGGLVWNAPTTRTQDSGIFTGRDPLTGEVKHEFAPNVKTYWFHHRCYMAKATDKFLLPSRTGIEFVDPIKKDWNINHWVRGGCLYGIMPCNGLTYAPPHNCACYPEAKLYGLNALAPASAGRAIAENTPQTDRLLRGKAQDATGISELITKPDDWPTYRRDALRSGSTSVAISDDLALSWETKLGGRLTAPTIARGRLFVAQIDAHTVHALDEKTGKQVWSYTAGGRVDSPPTFAKGFVLFGSADGHVYCVRASDGMLKWRFRAAPRDQRLMAFEQLESVWPVHGSVLVQGHKTYFVAGRSNYLDGGLRMFCLNMHSGELFSESIIDEKDPETGENLQARLKVLNMPVGLPDVLSSDGKYIYMRSQRFGLDGKREAIGPHSAQPNVQGAVQKGAGPHLFAPMGFLDDTYFHRSYWVYGRSFAGGHGGYYQAGKYAPSGRLLVHDDENVYGFGRKPQYYRWTTTIEHQLFAASKTPPAQARETGDGASERTARRRGGGVQMIRFEKTESLNPAGKAIVVSAWVNSESPNGVILARGGPTIGYALVVKDGKPQWLVRTSEEKLSTVEGKDRIVGEWTHLVAVLTSEKKMRLYVNGKLAGSGAAPALINGDPVQSLEIGGDDLGAVGSYRSPHSFIGTIDEVRIFHGDMTTDEVVALADPTSKPKIATAVIICSFTDGDATDASGNKNHGKLDGVRKTQGKFGIAMRFRGSSSPRSAGSFVQHHWTADVPLLVRAMVKAGDKLVIAGPPDLIDEEETFSRLTARDDKVQKVLADQNAALEGAQGAILRVVSAKDGRNLAEYKLKSLPVWDSMAVAGGRLFFSTADGSVLAYSGN
jgi:outer membrane protein assembly factor BamB